MKGLWRVVCLLPLLSIPSGCVTLRYPYVEPTGYDEHKFGTRIEEFDFTELELIGGDSLALFDCDTSLPLELSDYFKANEKSPYPGVVIDQVEYLYCFNGTNVEFCGVNIHYSSEEYDASDGIDPRTNTNHRRFVDALVRLHGKPHTGELPSDRIIIETFEGESFLLPRSLKFERYSWCAPGDQHAPPGCQNAIVVLFSPLLGEGEVLIATPALREFGAAYQRYTQYPYPTYRTLYNAEPETALKLPSRCKGERTANGEASQPDPADVDLDTAMKYLFSEQTLENAATEKNIIRPVREHGMTATEFFGTLEKTRECRYGKNTSDGQRSYCIGIERGVARRYFLGRYTTPAEDKKWRAARTQRNVNIQLVGMGYEDGANGILDIPKK